LKRNITFTMLTIVLTTLCGCASQRVSTNVDIPVDAGHAKFVIPAAIAGDVTPSAVVSRYASALSMASKWRLAYQNELNNTVGLLTETTPTGVRVSYVNRSNNTVHRHDFIGQFHVTQVTQGQNIVVDVACPSSMQEELMDMNIGLGQWKPFIESSVAAQDLRNICANSSLKFSHRENGDVNVNFGDAPVYANFARKLQPYTNSSDKSVTNNDLAKFKWFKVQDGKNQRVLGVTVFPYRSGSKVTYTWDNTITCKANSVCDFDPSAAKRMSDLVATIAND
jgi:hypothetical protein